MKFLEGKKSYLGAIAFFALGGLFGLGLITREQFEAFTALVAGWTTFSFRQAIK